MKKHGLGPKLRSAYLWTTGVNVTKSAIAFVLSILLARFLEPKDYGLVGMVTVFIGFLGTFQDVGLGQAVFSFDPDDTILPTYFTVASLTGVVLTLLGFASAPWIAAFYHEPRMIPIIQVLSVTLFLGSLGSVSKSLLSKRFQFRELTLIESGCALSCGLLAVVLAWKGFGVWSLVANLVSASFLQTTLMCWIVRPRFTARVDGAEVRKVLRFGTPLIGAELLWKFYKNSDYLVIGKFLGSVALGQYTLAYRLATVVNDKISVIVNRVTVPAFAALKDDRNALVGHWFSVTRKLALVNFALLVGIAMNGEDFITVALGQKWLPAVVPLRFLCAVGAWDTITPIINNLLQVKRRTDFMFIYSLFNAILLPVGFTIACQAGWGLAGVGILWCVLYPLSCLYQLSKALRLVDATFWDYWSHLMFPIGVAGICLVGMMPVSWLLPGGLVRLCVRAAVGIACFALCVSFRPGTRQILRDLLGSRTPAEAIVRRG